MLFKEEQQNCSLIFFPESHKGKTGFLLGINLTEFIVVVLDIVEVMSHEKSISELKSYVDLPAFKFIVRRFVHSEIKVLGAVINPENPDSNSETVQRLSQFDVWLNLEYKPSEDKLVFRDLILCGYRYNTTSSIIYYDTEASGFLTTDGKLLVKAMAQPDQEFSIESDHFDINVYQAYKCLQSDGGHLLPMNQSRDVFESVCKVINYRRLLLSIWHSVFNRSELLALDNVADDQSVGSNSFDLEKELVFGDGMVENVQARNRGSSSVFKAKGKIFNFEMEDMSSMDTFSAKRPKKFSEELLDDIEALNTPNIYKKQSAQSTVQKMADNKSIQSLNRIPENSLRELDPVKGRMIKKEPEWKFIFKILTALVQFMSVGYGAAFKLLNLVPYLDRILNTTYCHLLFRTKLALKMAVKLDKLVKQQPAKNSVLLKDVSFFVNTLSLTAFDLMIGWALFTLFFFYSQEIAGSIRDAQMLIHPDVFKRQLAMILDNPAGIKLNQTYCGIISKLTQTIFILQ